MRSLFIVSLPRSFSTKAHALVQSALGLRSPTWVLDGEILNVDRYAHYGATRFDEGRKFVRVDRDPVLFAQLTDFLDQAVASEGFVYKDVVQPFVLAKWSGLHNVRVVRVERELTDVAFSMLRQGWFYPANAADRPAHTPLLLNLARRFSTFELSRLVHAPFRIWMRDAVIQGLCRAQQALNSIAGVSLHHEDLIRDETHFQRAIPELYPEPRAPCFSYIDQSFIALRGRVLRRRQTRAYKLLDARVRAIRAAMMFGGPQDSSQDHRVTAQARREPSSQTRRPAKQP
jgi:hypothetical protein